jgi:uncharacterized membrane protein
MNNNPKHPILALITANWISMLGVALVTTAGFSWLFVLPTQVRGHASNPYIGILVFIAIPVIFIAGLLLIALGVFLPAGESRKDSPSARTGAPIFGNLRSSSP